MMQDEHVKYKSSEKYRLQTTMVNVHTLCHYAMLYNALQGAVSRLSFLAKPHQPNGYDDQMVLVEPLEGDKSDTPTTYGHPWHGLYHRPAHNQDHNHDHGPNSHGLSCYDPDLGPCHFLHMGYSSIT